MASVQRGKMKCPSINRALFPLKIVLFCWYGASSSLIPYMTIHMKELGITVEETAIIYTLLPVTQLVCTPLAGMIADKLGRYKDVLMLSVLSSVAFATAILFVPPVPVPRVEHPDIHLLCGPVVLPHVVVENCWGGPCDIFYTNRSNPLITAGCSVYCPDGDTEFVSITDLCTDNRKCTVGESNILLKDANFTISMHFDYSYPERSSCFYPVKAVSVDNSTILSKTFRCPIKMENKSECSVKCSFRQLPNENGTLPHLNQCVRTTGNKVLTFWLYFVLRIVFNIFMSICLTLLDATALAMVQAHGGHYGRQRFWAILAQAVFSPVTGFLVDLLSDHRGYMDYSPAFHFYNVLAVVTAIAVWMMNVDVPPPAENVLKNFRKLLRVPPVIVLMIVIFWLGAMWGFVESFLFWYLLDLGSPNFLLGLTLTTGAIVGLPFLHESDWFVKKVGQVNLLIIALFFYFVRFFGYSYINDPWWCIPFEAMEAFTYHLMWVAAATYSAQLAPVGLLATIQGCVGGLHYGVGRGSGSFAGGTMMGRFGARLAFRVMGVSSGAMFVLYAALYYTWLRKYDKILLDKGKTPDMEMNVANDVKELGNEDFQSGQPMLNQDSERLENHQDTSLECSAKENKELVSNSVNKGEQSEEGKEEEDEKPNTSIS